MVCVWDLSFWTCWPSLLMELSATRKTFQLSIAAFLSMLNLFWTCAKYAFTVLLRHASVCMQSLGGKFVCTDPDCLPGFSHPALQRKNYKRSETKSQNQ